MKKSFISTISVNRKGNGFVLWPEDHPKVEGQKDIEVQNEDLAGALSGDSIEVEVIALHPRPKGRVLSVVTRAKTRFAATFKKNNGAWYALPDDRRVYKPMRLVGDTSMLAENTKGLVELQTFEKGSDPTAQVLEIFGTAGEHKHTRSRKIMQH